MKVKIFSTTTGNRKPKFDALEDAMNEWLADHPDIVIEHVNDLTQPNAGWTHIALAVWYSES